MCNGGFHEQLSYLIFISLCVVMKLKTGGPSENDDGGIIRSLLQMMDIFFSLLVCLSCLFGT